MQCCYRNCSNNSKNVKKSVIFYPFPKLRTQKEKFDRWVQNCGIYEPSEISRSSYICSEHFEKGSPTNARPDPVAWDEISLEQARKKKTKKIPKNESKPIVIEDDVPFPKGKGKIALSDDGVILNLQCWEEDLSPVQVEYAQKADKEYNEILNRLEQLIKQNSGELVHKGETVVAYQYSETPPALTTINQSNGPMEATPTITTTVSNMNPGNIVLQGKSGQSSTYQLVMDPRLGLIVGTMTPTTQSIGSPATTTVPQTAPAVAAITPQVRMPQKRRGRPSMTNTNMTNVNMTNPPPLQPMQTYTPTAVPPPQPQPSTSTASNVRPAESTAVGGLATGAGTRAPAAIVDLTNDDGKPAADSREVAFNKLQGKTFPSLVVVARPHLHAKEAAVANDRSLLDTKVKQVLVYTATKFTEWLIQQGLVRSEQHCSVHPANKLNLGMYSDVSKFPYSGGYVWISECCPHRFVSVFSGSLFEGATHPPTVLLKLIYHWACQTNIQNVVQWVKVDNLYVKGLFTWLRAVCTFSLQKHLKPMGGLGKKIEVGVISLGTTSQDGSQRQVKVEVLGILDTEARLVRLRAVEPLADGERNYKRRFSKILEPLKGWVHSESTIATDLTVDKGTLQFMGFNHVIQNTPTGGAVNQGIMEYLRKIVPRMFQNTLSLLSRQIIQQFLDELVWREWYGQTANQAFNNMSLHLAEQTRLNTSDTLIQRLNKVAANPFKNHWIMYQGTPASKLPDPTTIKRYNRKRTAVAPTTAIIDLEKPQPPPKKQHLTYIPSESEPTDLNNMVPLESYYYGTMEGDSNNPLASKITFNVRCCICKVPYQNNLQLLDHLLAHAHNISAKTAVTQCKYCLASLPSVGELNRHIGEAHPIETKSYVNAQLACIICEIRFNSVYMLGKHMSREHVPQELPYQCGTCNFRCSSHRQVIDHFYKEHDRATTLQCPFCLKSTAVWSSGRVMSTNVNFFLAHLQKHQKKSMAKKCPKCALWFIHKETHKDHLAKAHTSCVGRKGLRPWTPPGTLMMVPKSKLYQATLTPSPSNTRPSTPEVIQHNLVLDLPCDTVCMECGKAVENGGHYPQKLNCASCRYVTDCLLALQKHKHKCCQDKPPVMPRFRLDAKLHCVCGYSSDDGHQMAKHLALCERKSAYPTAERAQAATVTHSMLDVLGLVRRNDDSNQGNASAEEDKLDVKDASTPENEQDIDPEVTVIEDIIETNEESIESPNFEPKIEITESEVTTVE